MEIWQLVAILATIIGSAVGLGYRIGKQSEKIESSINSLRGQQNSQLTLLGTLIRILHGRKALSGDEFAEVLASYTQMVLKTSIPANPLSPQERNQLENYISKARRGEFFSPDEVQEYTELVRKLEREKKGGDPGVWPLAALGAFLLGLFVASQKK